MEDSGELGATARFRLWNDLTKQAWGSQLVDLAEQGCEVALASAQWDDVKERPLVVATAQLHFVAAEVAVARVLEEGLDYHGSLSAAPEEGSRAHTLIVGPSCAP